VIQVVKNPPATAGDAGDAGWIPGSGRSLEEKKNAKLDILKLRTFALRKTLKKIKRQATEKCFIYI